MPEQRWMQADLCGVLHKIGGKNCVWQYAGILDKILKVLLTELQAERLTWTSGDASCIGMPGPLKDQARAPGTLRSSRALRPARDHRLPTDGAQIGERYVLGRTLGRGSFGVVHEAWPRAGDRTRCAAKKIWKERCNIAEFNNEVRVMERMDHPSILRLLEVFEDQAHLYLVTELCEGGDLLELMLARLHRGRAGLPEPEAVHLFRQMAAAVHHCHMHDVAHRDVKLDNFLLVDRSRCTSESRLKLCDMGLARTVPPGGFTKPCGSPPTLAPEVLQADRGGPPYGLPCDLWSLGSVLYSLLSGDIAQGPETGSGWEARLRRGVYDMSKEPWPLLSEDARHLVRSLMCLDVRCRLTAEACTWQPWLSLGGPNELFKAAYPAIAGDDFQSGHCQRSHLRRIALHVLARQDGAPEQPEDETVQVSPHRLADALAMMLPDGNDNALVWEWLEANLPAPREDAGLGQTDVLAATFEVEEDP